MNSLEKLTVTLVLGVPANRVLTYTYRVEQGKPSWLPVVLEDGLSRLVWRLLTSQLGINQTIRSYQRRGGAEFRGPIFIGPS